MGVMIAKVDGRRDVRRDVYKKRGFIGKKVNKNENS